MASLKEVSVGATKGAFWAARDLGRQAGNAGKDLIQRAAPGLVPPELVAQQSIWKQFEHRVGFVDLLDEDLSAGEMEDHAYIGVDAMVEQGVVHQGTAVRLRLVLPGESVGDPSMDKRNEYALDRVELALEEENIMAFTEPLPITPSRRERVRPDRYAAWRAMTPELAGYWLQFDGDENFEPAVLGLTGRTYERTLFGGHTAVRGHPIGSNALVLDRAGERPQGNVLAWLHSDSPFPVIDGADEADRI